MRRNKVDIILSDITSVSEAVLEINYLTASQLNRNTNYGDKELIECISEIASYALQRERKNA